MLTNLFFNGCFCDGEWSDGALAKSAYTLETRFKNVQLIVTPCKIGDVTGNGLVLRGY